VPSSPPTSSDGPTWPPGAAFASRWPATRCSLPRGRCSQRGSSRQQAPLKEPCLNTGLGPSGSAWRGAQASLPSLPCGLAAPISSGPLDGGLRFRWSLSTQLCVCLPGAGGGGWGGGGRGWPANGALGRARRRTRVARRERGAGCVRGVRGCGGLWSAARRRGGNPSTDGCPAPSMSATRYWAPPPPAHPTLPPPRATRPPLHHHAPPGGGGVVVGEGDVAAEVPGEVPPHHVQRTPPLTASSPRPPTQHTQRPWRSPPLPS
jgi:hypothetical protein